jgi:two-component system sensor histidine kinase ChvG
MPVLPRSKRSTASVTVTAKAEHRPRLSSETTPQGDVRQVPRRRRRRLFSPLTWRILAVNVFALAILVGGLLFLGQYRESLIDAELDLLQTQGRLFALAIGDGAVTNLDEQQQEIQPEAARRLVRRLAEPMPARIRLFGHDGSLIADSRVLIGPGGQIQIEELPPPDESGWLLKLAMGLYDWVENWLPQPSNLPDYFEAARQRAEHYDEVNRAIAGDASGSVRAGPNGRMVLSVAVPVQHYKQVLGALMLSKDGDEIDRAVRSVRLDILRLFVIALAVTVMLSLYLAGTIARPVHRLATAAERVRRGYGRNAQIPDLTGRGDEIGDLSLALRDMTDALRQRMDAIEGFAADVAHEIKNPLTSLHSAVETATRVSDPDQQRQLMAIIREDVQRLDRLITDISDASRLDAELSRAESGPVDIGGMLKMLVEVHSATAKTADGSAPPRLALDAVVDEDLTVTGIEGRMVQVFRNLISNAISFSPPGGIIRIRAKREGDFVTVTIEDQGPGIPAGREKAVFERFYSERPETEKFGTHSGLGLSISKQIVEAHGGTLVAQNRNSDDNHITGARFIARFPILAADAR